MKRSRPNSVRLFLISSILFLTASLASGQITFPNLPYQISLGDGQNNGHTMCYNPTRNEYLIAYMAFPTTGRRVIQYYRLDSTGTKIGGPVDVIDNLEGSSGPSVCYNSARQEYLISYQGYTSAGGLHSELRIQRVNAVNGALIGGSTWIRNSPTVMATKVSYSPTSDSYLLIWEDQATAPWPVYGLRLNSTAGSVGSIFNISNGTYKYAGDPSIAYNSVNNEFLVSFSTYYDPDPGNTCWNLFAQRVRASDGVLLGGNITIGATTACEQGANIGYDSNMNRYLVVFEEGGNSPKGQFVSNTGTLVGSKFEIGISPYNGGMANVAWNSLTREWFVTWASCCSADNYALRLSQTGTAIGSPLPLTGAVQGFGNWDPLPVYNSTNNEMLICWFWQYAIVYVRRAQAAVSQTSVSINLGFTNIEDLMTHPIGGDGDTVGVASIGGRECRKNMDPGANDFYFYFTVNDGWAFQGNKQDVWIYCDYYDDATTGSITLNYDAVSSAYKDGGTVWLTGTNTWKTQKWHVTDAYFGNRENNGGDFRIYVGNVTRHLDQSTVNQNTPSTTPPGQASAPSPANGATGVSTTPTLTWTAGANATAHNVFFGTINPPPFAAVKTTTSHAPGTLAAGTTYYWRIDEYRTGGGTTNGPVWSFTTTGGLPGLATNPSPANGATGVSITGTTLTWTAGSGATSHDVRFGTANPPPFIQNQAGTSYNPGTMAAGTTYFWRIDEKNGAGTTTGTVWSFTTLPLPGLASAPNPANGATGVSNSPTLSWTAGSNATSHDVRFGTANPPPFIQNQAGTSYGPGGLIGATTYFWRIDEKNGSGTTTGTVWSFTTTSCFNDAFAYANGNLNGNGSWTGTATSQIQIVSQMVRVNGGSGGFDANRTISCTGTGGIIQVHVKVQGGTGVDNMWSLWFDDPAGVNICRWYGAATTARGRIGGSALVTGVQTLTGGLDTLLVKINTTTKTAEFFFNGTSIGTLDYTGQGAANTLGRIRFQRFNHSGATGNFLSFDNLTVY